KVIQQEYIPFVHVNASDKPRFVRNRIMKKIERFTTLRKNLFERVYPIKAQLAQKLIDAGYLHYSKFGKFCPVSLHNGDCFPPPFGPDKSPCTVIYRKYIYYLADEEARNEFIKNPMFYARQSPPKSLIPAKIAIVGPPKSGKTTGLFSFFFRYLQIQSNFSNAEASIETLEALSKISKAKLELSSETPTFCSFYR
ncbi:unnamed protein product, partial [Rotaria magnacalcarata]